MQEFSNAFIRLIGQNILSDTSYPLTCHSVSVLMWKMGCRLGEVLWTLPSVRAPVWSSRQTASAASLSSIDPTQILTSRPRRCQETHRRPVSCEL